MDQTAFFLEFLKHPLEVGSLIPSSNKLAESMCRNIDCSDDSNVVELGPGLGSFTKYISDQITEQGNLILVEINPRFRSELARRHQHCQIVPELNSCHLEMEGKIDLVICGLPFTSIPLATSRSTVDLAAELLAPTGRFVTFFYFYTIHLPKNQRLLRHIGQRFSRTERRSCLWNLPPAIVVDSQK